MARMSKQGSGSDGGAEVSLEVGLSSRPSRPGQPADYPMARQTLKQVTSASTSHASDKLQAHRRMRLWLFIVPRDFDIV